MSWVRLTNSQISVVLRRGSSVTGSCQCLPLISMSMEMGFVVVIVVEGDGAGGDGAGLGDGGDGAELGWGWGWQASRLGRSGGDAEFEDLEGAVGEVEALAGGVGEVDDQVGALGGGEEEVGERDRGGEQALIGADLLEGLLVGEREGEEVAVGGVEHAETVEAGFHLEEGADLAVDEDGVAVELADPGVFGVVGDGVEELAVGGEVAVVEGEGDLVLAGG